MILKKYDIFFSDGCEEKSRGNLLIKNPISKGDGIFLVTCCIPEGISSSRTRSDVPHFCFDQEHAEVLLRWDDDKLPPHSEVGEYMLIGVQANPADQCRFHVDQFCTPVALLKPTSGPLGILEMCSGAFGGWKRACDLISESCLQSFRVLSIDSCFDTAWHYAVGHSAVFTDAPASVPASCLSVSPHMVVCSDIASPEWISLAGLWGVEIATISPPCQPWSSAGLEGGLNTLDGATCAEAIGVCKMLRPRIILLEEVSGFAGHPDRSYITKLLHWAGYQVKFSKHVDAGQVCAAARTRFLMMAVRTADSCITPRDFQVWTAMAGVNPLSLGCVLDSDWTKDPRLTITQDIKDKASNPELLPPVKKRRLTPQETFENRCKPPCIKAPTIVASYGHQHDLPAVTLAKKGLLCHFVKHEGLDRFWHPIELLLMHCFTGSHLIATDGTSAYKHVGNMICTPHALLMLTEALNWLPHRAIAVDLNQVIQRLHDMHVTADSMHTIELKAGTHVSQHPIALLPSQIEFLDSYWGTDHGKHELPDGFLWTLNGLLPMVECPRTLTIEDSPIDLIQDSVEFLPVLCMDKPLLKIQIDRKVDLEQLARLWNGQFEFFWDNDQCLMCKGLQETKLPSEGVLLAFLRGTLFMLSRGDDVTAWIVASFEGTYFDVFGLCEPTDLVNAILIHDVPRVVQPRWNLTAMTYLAAFQKCQVVPFAKCDDSAFGFTCKGNQVDIGIVLAYWSTVLPTKLVDELGFRISLDRTDTQFRLEIIKGFATPDIPLFMLCSHIFVEAFNSVFRLISGDDCISIRVKLFDRIIWDDKFPGKWQLESFMMLVHSIGFWVHPTLRVLVFGRQVDWQMTLAQLKGTMSQLRIGFLLPLSGGGPTTKMSHKTQVKNAIAAVLLEEGYDLKWITDAVESLIDKVGVKELSKALSANRGTRLQIARRFLKECQIPLPEVKPSMTSQSAFIAKRARPNNMPNPAHYRAVEGSLVNEDGTPTPFISAFGGQLTGYHTIAPADATPWLKGTEVLSKDELILLIFGEHLVKIDRPHSRITLPCYDEHGSQVLISCTMVQYGDKKVVCHEGDGFQVDSQESTLIAMTVEYEDWKENWPEITKFTFRWFRQQSFLQDALINVWGRSFRRGKTATSPDDSTSVQVHMLIKNEHLVNTLKASGAAGMWATPKTKCGKIDQGWKLIWLDAKCDHQSAMINSAKVADGAGLVRVKGRYAIRIAKANFSSAWTTLFPGIAQPELLDATTTWKVESLPYGVTREMLGEWSKHVKWPVKPLRAVGPKAWVVGASSPPPTLHLYFNSAPVLIRELTAKQVPVNPIIAGPKPKMQRPLQELGPLRGDPWAGYNPINPPANTAATAQVGPTETKFQQQETRIAKLEETLKSVQLEQKQCQGAIKQVHSDLQQRDENIKSHLDSRLQGIKQEIDSSFTTAMKQQASSFEAGFLELKKLLVKRPRDEDNMET